jgi:hypothetical protein
MKTRVDEIRIAEAIVSVLPAGVARTCSSDRMAICYTVRADGLKLRSIVLKRHSLRRLADDPAIAVKIEYLQRDLIKTATVRTEFRYPRLHLHPASPTQQRPFRFALPFASMM